MGRTETEWKICGTVSAVLAGTATRKVLAKLWARVTGKNPPANPASPSTTWAEGLAWASLTGAAMGVARMVAARQAAQVWKRANGTLPPGVEEVS
ncbi:MAG: DUF4235 domain-containing protein [Actinomycetota bacterium]|nr:DUF4235 domain-containing protein [Actinomycetota bacterium]